MKFRSAIKRNKLKIIYLFILIVIFSIFMILAFLNYQVRKQIPQFNILLNPINYSMHEYPILKNNVAPYISAQGAIVLDKDSQVSLVQKNPTLRFSPASTTKIMTALIALEYFKPNDELTILSDNVEGSVLGFEKGEKITFQNLIYAMMLPSSNDATLAIAQNFPGGEEAFVALMNKKAKELNLTSTQFADPIGLLDEEDFTTPLDLARLTTIAMKNPEFATIVSTKKKEITNSVGKKYKFENLNVLLDIPGVNGVKTGFTEGAGQVLVTSRKIPGTNKDLIIVVMQSADRFGDTQTLLNYLENNINFQTIQP
jgi:serine-type D-Ala-D-Ala carboxypeptidase (penicillin-binding protein 5/6)